MADSFSHRLTPSIWLIVACLLLAVPPWPPLLEEFISLDWKLCDMRQVALCCQLLLVFIAALIFVFRRQINMGFSQKGPSGKGFTLAIVAISVATIGSLAVMELGLRLFRDPLKMTWQPAEYQRAQYDPVLGWTYIPNKSVMQTFIAGQPPVPVHINEQGIRVQTPGTLLSPNRPTVIFVGGSYTMGYGLRYEDTFIGQLAAKPNFPYQVVNLGVEAFGTDQAWLRLKRYMNKFNTIAVVYTFIPSHVDRNLNYDRRLLFPGIRMVGTKPLFGVKRDGSVYLKRAPVGLENYGYLRLWAILHRAWIKWGPRPSLKLSRVLIDEMGQDVNAAGATFIVVYWSFWDDDCTYAYPVFNNIKFPLVDLCAHHPVGWRDMRLPGDSHPNVEAGTYVAKSLARKMAELGLMPEE